MNELLFSSASIADLLLNIEELSGLTIGVSETETGVDVIVGETTYHIDSNDAAEIEVAEDVVDEVGDVVSDAYDDLADGMMEEAFNDAEIVEPVTGGPIKKLLKTLMLGGMVKLTAKMLQE